MRRKHPKAGLDFSDDGAYMALVHRQECKDVIRIYSTETWQPLSEFFADTVDMVDLKWSPNGRMLAVWDSNLHYNVLVYSIDGRRLEHYSAYAPHHASRTFRPPTNFSGCSRSNKPSHPPLRTRRARQESRGELL